MSEHMSGVVSGCTEWLVTAFPPATSGSVAAVRHRWQAWAAVDVAARLRYPSVVDDELLALCGPGGSARLDELTGSVPDVDGQPWRTWVDEALVSWAAALLADLRLASAAAAAVGAEESHAGPLVAPAEKDLAAAALLRHPDLLEPVAALHRADLLAALAG